MQDQPLIQIQMLFQCTWYNFDGYDIKTHQQTSVVVHISSFAPMKVELQLQLNSEAAGKKKSTVYYYESMQKGKTLILPFSKEATGSQYPILLSPMKSISFSFLVIYVWFTHISTSNSAPNVFLLLVPM